VSPRIDEAIALPPRELWPERACDLPHVRYSTDLNLSVELVDRHLPACADHCAVVAPDRRLTYAELSARIAHAGHRLRHAGARAGDRVLIRLPNGAALVTAWLAVQRIGAIAVTTSASLRARELAAIIDDAEPSVSITASHVATELWRACASATRAPRVLLEDELQPADAPDQLDPVARPRDAVAVIIYTADAESALPKGACHSAADLLATADTYSKLVLGAGPDDVFGGPASPAFAFGLGAMLVFPLRAGATTVLSDGFDADAQATAIGREGVTLYFGTATTYRLLLRAPDFDRHADLRSLRVAISSGEQLEVELAIEWRRRTSLDLLDGFGTTEMAHMFLAQWPRDCGSGRLGEAVPGYDVRVVDDRFTDVEAGAPGRLIVRGPTGCRYWRRIEAQRRYVQRGWNVTGDWCVRHEGLRFRGRRDNLIVSAGYNVSAPEVEAVLREHPAIADVAVVSAPDPIRGSVPKAVVVLRDQAARDGIELALLQHVRDTLAGYKCPRRLEIARELPRDGSGAIDRLALVTC
jgi:2-aminobenzoate-CoA ligase